MSLNIKNPEAHELASELARLTGESLTKAVTEALRERLERERRKRDEERLVADLMAIAREASKARWPDHRTVDDFLYDEHGLPRS